jgi:hypothetical protein
MLRSAMSDYIDRIVDGRRLRQRVITQPRPTTDIGPNFFIISGLNFGGYAVGSGLPRSAT